jgi:transposase
MEPPRSMLSAEEQSSLISTLQAELMGLKAEVTAQVQSLHDTIANLAHENALLKRRLYGNKTERSHTAEAQLALGDLFAEEQQLQKELEAAVAKATAESEPEDPKDPVVPRGPSKPRGRRDLLASNLPRCVVEIRDANLEEQGARLIDFDDSTQLMFQRGGYAVLVKRIAQYAVKQETATTGAAANTTVLAARSPEVLFPRAMLHTSAIANVTTLKFSLGTPLYRLEQDSKDRGVALDRGTMSRYIEQVGNTFGATIVHAMWTHALQRALVISTDATGAMIQPEKSKDGRPQSCKKGHFFTAVVDCDAVLFSYAENHTSEFVQKLFAGFRGYLQADASSVYDILERGRPKDSEAGVKLVGCMAHCRRYFFEAAICRYPEGVQGLLRIRSIFAADQAVRRVPSAERTALRNRHVRPLMEDFFRWVHQTRTTIQGRNLATKALGYAANQEHELMRVLDDPSLPLDNTRAERALRKIVVGRKSWMFYGSDTHAEAAAAIFSIIASCRLHALDPYQYIEEMLRLLAYWPRDRYLELAPQFWRATRAKLDPKQLASPLTVFTIPPAETGEIDLAPPPA